MTVGLRAAAARCGAVDDRVGPRQCGHRFGVANVAGQRAVTAVQRGGGNLPARFAEDRGHGLAKVTCTDQQQPHGSAAATAS